MKKITVILFAFILLCSQKSFAQWVHQNSGTTDILLNVFFPTKDTGYVSGIIPDLLKTTNGGASWNVVPNSPQAATLYFTSRDTGYAISNDTIFKTMNGGILWISQYSNSSLILGGAIHFSDKLTGYTSGLSMNQDTMYFIKTVNGGNTWNIVSWIIPTFSFIPFLSIHFVSRDTGFFVGYDSHIYRTVNGCASVTSVFSSAAVLRAIHFPSKDTGYAVGYPDALVKTTNRGASWSILPTTTFNEPYNDVFFTTKDTGFIVVNEGSFTYGKILKTTNGGNNWVTQITDTTLYTIHFPTRTIGYAVGDNGTILKHGGVIGIKENENASWFSLYPNPTSGIFTLQSSIQSSSHSTITVFNSLGAVIYKSEITNQKSEIDLSSHPAGIYLVKVTEGDKIAVQKIVKM